MPMIKKGRFDQVIDAGKNLTLYVNNARIYAKELFGSHNEYELTVEIMENEGLRVQNFFDKPEQYPVDDDWYEHEELMDYGRDHDDWVSEDYEIYSSGPDDDYFEYLDNIYGYDE